MASSRKWSVPPAVYFGFLLCPGVYVLFISIPSPYNLRSGSVLREKGIKGETAWCPLKKVFRENGIRRRRPRCGAGKENLGALKGLASTA